MKKLIRMAPPNSIFFFQDASGGKYPEIDQRYLRIWSTDSCIIIASLSFMDGETELIVSDEEKHHAVSHAMLSTLKGDLNWTKPEDALRGLYNLGAEKDKLLAVTEGFIEVERTGIKEYKKLIKESKGYYHDLFVLLFQSMVHDSEKHVKILEFLRQRLKEA